jgi:hypothetical protein
MFTNKIKAAQAGVEQFGKGNYRIVPAVSGKEVGYAVVAAVEPEPLVELGAWPWPKAAQFARAAAVVRASTAAREVRNGVRARKPGSVCGKLWEAFDTAVDATVADVRAYANANKLNVNNAVIEFYEWRKFNA